MSIRFEDVTRDNFMACIRLQPREDQRHFVAPNAVSLAESKFYPELVPQAIYARDTLVGFLMWAPEEPDDGPGTIWLVRLMIDARYQGNGMAAPRWRRSSRSASQPAGDADLLQLRAGQRRGGGAVHQPRLPAHRGDPGGVRSWCGWPCGTSKRVTDRKLMLMRNVRTAPEWMVLSTLRGIVRAAAPIAIAAQGELDHRRAA